MQFISVLIFVTSLGALAMDEPNSLLKNFAQEIELNEGNCENLIQAVDHIFAEDKQAFLELLEKVGEPGMPEQIIELVRQHIHNRTIANPNAMCALGYASLCIETALSIYHKRNLEKLNLARIKRRKCL